MRPQQQNRRMRGRSNNGNSNNRKGPNPLSRNYESNGPDVKIRGSAQQVAEKYSALARDAQSAGDRVMAENYLQHAEHYYRIIAAAQAQLPVQQQLRDNRDEMDDDIEDDTFIQQDSRALQPQVQPVDGSGPQPVIEGMPAEVALNPEAVETSEKRERRSNGYPTAVAEGEEDVSSRRIRRPRRPRSRSEPVEQAGGGDGSETKDEAAAPDKPTEDVSDPAAA